MTGDKPSVSSDMFGTDIPSPNMLQRQASECEKLRKLNSDYKQQIHVLRKRCESLTREMESLRAGRQATPVVRQFDGINQEPQQD